MFECTKQLIQGRIDERLLHLKDTQELPKDRQSSLHFEYLGEIEDEIKEQRRALAVLNSFDTRDLKIPLKVTLNVEEIDPA